MVLQLSCYCHRFKYEGCLAQRRIVTKTLHFMECVNELIKVIMVLLFIVLVLSIKH